MKRSLLILPTILALLLSGVVAVAGHEHATDVLRSAALCFIDHDSHPEAEAAPEGPGARAAGAEHEHHCLACHAARDRVDRVAGSTTLGELAATGAAPVGASHQAGTATPAAPGARGPPPTLAC